MISGMIGGAFAGLGQVASGASKFCFIAGTQVLTKDGRKNIEDIKVGEYVPCVNEFTGECDEKKVLELSVRETNKLVTLRIGGEEITCTPEHPFAVKDRGFVEAGKLAVGDLIYDKEYNVLAVESTISSEFTENVKVYNFTVEDNHTYFVLCLNLLVHNGCGKYYEATRTNNGVAKGAKITQKQALQNVRNGKDVLASSRSAGKSLAKKTFAKGKVIEEISKGENYLWHFHDIERFGGHIFYGG